MYIALRTRNKGWGAFAVAYAVLTILTISYSSHPMAGLGIVFIYLAGVIHGFVENVRFIRKIDKNYVPKPKYYNNRWYPPGQEPIQGYPTGPYGNPSPGNQGYASPPRSHINLGSKEQVNSYVGQKIMPDYPAEEPMRDQFAAPPFQHFAPAPDVPYQSSPPAVLNVNEATLEQLAALPGFDIHLARMTIQLREEQGNLYSVEQLADKLGLSARVVLQLRPLLTFTVTS